MAKIATNGLCGHSGLIHIIPEYALRAVYAVCAFRALYAVCAFYALYAEYAGVRWEG